MRILRGPAVTFFALMLVFLNAAIAEESAGASKHSFSLGATTGLLDGRGEQTIYVDFMSDYYLSELRYYMEPLYYAGAVASYTGNRFFMDASVKFGFPGKTGRMEDRDWLSDRDNHMGSSYTDGVYNPDWLTHYSVHDTITESAILADGRAGFSWAMKGGHLFKVYAAYNFMHFSWAVRGGSGLYPGGHFYFDDKHPDYKNTMTYTQTWHIVSPGFSFYADFNSYFGIELFYNMSVLVFCSGEDHHLLRYVSDPDDYMISRTTPMFGLHMEPGLNFSYKATDSLTWSLHFSWRIAAGWGNRTVSGDEILRDYGKHKINTGNMENGYMNSDIGLILTYKLF